MIFWRGLIRPSQSSWDSALVFAPKSDGSLRLCVDYKEMNKLTIRSKYPLPRVDDVFDQLHEAVVFSQMELATGFHQLRVAKDSIPLTTFRGPDFFLSGWLCLSGYQCTCILCSSDESCFQRCP